VTVAALLGASATRFALSYFDAGVPFATYFPAVLICTLLAGWRYGLACALLCGILAEFLFPVRSVLGEALPFSVGDFLLFLASCTVIIATASALRHALRELDRATHTAHHLNQELQHRVRNMLSVVQVLASQSMRGTSPEAFMDAFGGRLQALATAHALLGRRRLETCTLPELIEEACQPFCNGDNIINRGPACELPATSCVPLVLALHELCTNAVKYGALSSLLGRVEVSWSFDEFAHRVVIQWKETGGPAVSRPNRKGLGSNLLLPQPGIADVKVSFDKPGLRCQFTIDGAKALGPIGSNASQTTSLAPATAD
jgi:two-component sensor histidine kinase